MSLLVVSLVGVLLFAWPFLGLGLPADTPALAAGLAAVTVLVGVEASSRRLDTRSLALLATIAAVDSVLRLALVVGVAGFSPIFFLVLCAGYALGPRFGFLAGALSLLVSALVTGGTGPWVPYEMFGVGWVGMAAGLVGHLRRGEPGRADLALLAATGAALGLLYGAVLDVWDWTGFRGDAEVGWVPGMPAVEAAGHFARFYLTTSLAYDSFRAVGNAVMVVALGTPILLALHRFRRRFTVTVVPVSGELVTDGPASALSM